MNRDKQVADFMNSFIDNTPEPEIDHEYFEIEKEYESIFGHPVPGEMIPDSISLEQIKSAMKQCIKTRTDSLFDLLGVKTNNEFMY